MSRSGKYTFLDPLVCVCFEEDHTTLPPPPPPPQYSIATHFNPLGQNPERNPALVDALIINSTAGAYNQDIDEQLACELGLLCETSIEHYANLHVVFIPMNSKDCVVPQDKLELCWPQCNQTAFYNHSIKILFTPAEYEQKGRQAT